MLEVGKDNEIVLTRGDSLELEVGMFDRDGEEYEPQEGDTIRFAMSIGYKGNLNYKLILHKNISTETKMLILDPQDTDTLPYRKYNYDIEITYADGRVDTFISSTLTLVGETE